MPLEWSIWIHCSNVNQVVVTAQPLSLWMFSNDISVYSVKTECLLPDGCVVTLACELFRGRLKCGPGQNVCSGWSFNANVMPNTMMNNNVSYVIILRCMFWTSTVPALFIPAVLSQVKNSSNLKLSLLMQKEEVERLYPAGICEHQQVKILGIIPRSQGRDFSQALFLQHRLLYPPC